MSDIIVDDTDLGCVFSGSWFAASGSGGYNDDIHYGNTGGTTATYSTILTSTGAWTVSYTWPASSAYFLIPNTTVHWAVKDGSTVLGSGILDQSALPAADLVLSGSDFQILGTYTFSSTAASLVLTRGTSTGDTLADAVCFSSVGIGIQLGGAAAVLGTALTTTPPPNVTPTVNDFLSVTPGLALSSVAPANTSLAMGAMASVVSGDALGTALPANTTFNLGSVSAAVPGTVLASAAALSQIMLGVGLFAVGDLELSGSAPGATSLLLQAAAATVAIDQLGSATPVPALITLASIARVAAFDIVTIGVPTPTTLKLGGLASTLVLVHAASAFNAIFSSFLHDGRTVIHRGRSRFLRRRR